MHLSSMFFIFLFKYNNLHKSPPIYFMTIFEAKYLKNYLNVYFLNTTTVIKSNIGDEIFQYHDHFMNI